MVFALLRYDTDEEGHILTETLLDVIHRVVCIFHHVVKEGCDNRVCSQHQFLCHNGCYCYRMDDIRLARLTLLTSMGFIRQFKSCTNPCHILCGHPLLHHGEYSGCHLHHFLVVILHHNRTSLIVTHLFPFSYMIRDKSK